jgi:DNA repair exonuclease SbcCD ATPase subunit
MRKLNIKYAAAYNFLPFGPDGIKIAFHNYGNVVLIRGENRDAKHLEESLASDEMRVSSNGTGKSSIQEIVVYGLYGKTVKRPEKVGANDVVHNKVGKDARVEIHFDDYRVVRTRKDGGNDKKNTLRLWESPEGRWDKDTEVTLGTMALTQKRIEDIIGLSYDAFINICIFTDDQRACFLECDNRQKKEIVENMLSLSTYRQWHEGARSLKKELKGQIDIKAKEYMILENNVSEATKRLEASKQKVRFWYEVKIKEVEDVSNKIATVEQMMEKTGGDQSKVLKEYEDAQAKIKEIEAALPSLDERRTDIDSKIKLANEKETKVKAEAQKTSDALHDLARKIKGLKEDKDKKKSDIDAVASMAPGANCDKCMGEIMEQNLEGYAAKVRKEITEIDNEIKILATASGKISEEATKTKDMLDKIRNFLQQQSTDMGKVDSEIRLLNSEMATCSKVKEPKVDQHLAVLSGKLDELRKLLDSKKKELDFGSPFAEMVKSGEDELVKDSQLAAEKKQEVAELEAQLPYVDYWITGFGDQGIRKWVVDGVVPELNSGINYWLQFLIDNRITLQFDNELNETIQRNPADGDPYVYHAMSTGQRRRLNLAVSQSFAHVMSMSSGSLPSLMFLDEVTTNVDPAGVLGIFNMIMEIAQDKQVFITTHDHDLLRMLGGCDAISLVHENGYAKLID